MPQIVVDDIAVHYLQTGKGADVLLLHGWADNSSTFNKLTKLVDDKKHRFTALDLPGFGKSHAPPKPWDLDDYAGFLEKFVQKTRIKPQAVIGHSNGGALAIKSIATNTLAAKKLVLLAASGVRKGGGIKRNGIKVIAKAGKLATFWLPKPAKSKLQKKLYGTVGSDMLIAPELKETFKRTVRQDIQADASKLSVPTLLIYGERDKATPVVGVGSRLRGLIKDSHFVVIHGAEHFVHHDQPDRVAKLIKEFL